MKTACEVLVAGGGSAGLAAAVSAARAGAETLLIERAGFLGGMGTAALVHTLCGLYFVREEEGAVFANPGFAETFARRLIAAGGAGPPVRMGRLDVLPHDPAALALLADQIVRETPRLRVWLHTELIAATENRGNWHLEAVCRGVRHHIETRAVVDASGDAALATVAGLATVQEPPERLQRPAYVVLLGGVGNGALLESGRLRLAHALTQAVKQGGLPRAALGAGFRAGRQEGTAFVTIDLAGGGTEAEWDPFSPDALAAVEQEGRALAARLMAFLRAQVAGFANAFVAAWPARAGVRESRRIVGRYELTGEDIRTGARFDDGIAWASWPMETRERATGPRWVFAEENRAAQIPLRALSHRDAPRFFAAGRCLSASHDALASVRVMGTCLATGEAAGLAAAWHNEAVDWNSLAHRINASRTLLNP